MDQARRRRGWPSLIAAALTILGCSAEAHGEGLNPSCSLPFSPVERHDIDDECGATGKAGSAAGKAQNEVKNNFCATGNATPLTIADLIKLQKKVDSLGINYGSGKNLPDDRSLLTDLLKAANGKLVGEGDMVSLVAFVIDAHYSKSIPARACIAIPLERITTIYTSRSRKSRTRGCASPSRPRCRHTSVPRIGPPMLCPPWESTRSRSPASSSSMGATAPASRVRRSAQSELRSGRSTQCTSSKSARTKVWAAAR